MAVYSEKKDGVCIYGNSVSTRAYEIECDTESGIITITNAYGNGIRLYSADLIDVMFKATQKENEVTE